MSALLFREISRGRWPKTLASLGNDPHAGLAWTLAAVVARCRRDGAFQPGLARLLEQAGAAPESARGPMALLRVTLGVEATGALLLGGHLGYQETLYLLATRAMQAAQAVARLDRASGDTPAAAMAMAPGLADGTSHETAAARCFAGGLYAQVLDSGLVGAAAGCLAERGGMPQALSLALPGVDWEVLIERLGRDLLLALASLHGDEPGRRHGIECVLGSLSDDGGARVLLAFEHACNYLSWVNPPRMAGQDLGGAGEWFRAEATIASISPVRMVRLLGALGRADHGRMSLTAKTTPSAGAVDRLPHAGLDAARRIVRAVALALPGWPPENAARMLAVPGCLAAIEQRVLRFHGNEEGGALAEECDGARAAIGMATAALRLRAGDGGGRRRLA